LRFNFRAWDAVKGEYDQGVGELSECSVSAGLSAVDEQQLQSTAGLRASRFGAWIASLPDCAAPRSAGFISVAHALRTMYDFSFPRTLPGFRFW